jgi:hypothetical protein
MTGHRKVIIMEMAHEELYNKLKGKEYIRFIQRKPGRFSPKSTMIYRRRDPKGLPENNLSKFVAFAHSWHS